MKRFSLLLLIVAATGFLVQAQDRQSGQEGRVETKRLILMDGTHESISGYSIEGDRVRYYSTERSSWEELPYSMIDWAATWEYAVNARRETEDRKRNADETAVLEKMEKDARFPLVAPGLRIPAAEGVFLLDTYQGKEQWIRLAQNLGDFKENTGKNILRGIINPVAGAKQTVELRGPRAAMQAHVLSPVIYFSIDPADQTVGYDSHNAGDHLRLVVCPRKKNKRLVATFEIGITGRTRQELQYVKTSVERVSDYWVKISPKAPLKPGEYALVEFDTAGLMNQFVWDFGVDPGAPPNPVALVGDPEAKEPVLHQRPRGSPGP